MLLFAAQALGCGADVAFAGGETDGVDAGTGPHEDPPSTSGNPPTGPINAGPLPPVCKGFPIAGLGTTWTESTAASGSQRPLRCLAENTPEISGRFVANAVETNVPDASGDSVAEPNRIYNYSMVDPRANQPAVYYVLTEMAIGHSALSPTMSYPGLDVTTGPFFMINSYYSGEVITLGRGGLPNGRLDVQIAAHEYGHHVIMSLTPELTLSTLHEGMADFLACQYTKEAGWMASVPIELQRPCQNARSWPQDQQDLKQACDILVDGFQSAGWDSAYPDDYKSLTDCASMEPPYPLEGHQTGMIVSGALWSIDQAVGDTVFLPIYLRALQLLPPTVPGDFGMLHQALVSADTELHGGAHVAAIEAELAKRGMLYDVGISDMELGTSYACMLTPKQIEEGLVPAGPIVPVARKRSQLR